MSVKPLSISLTSARGVAVAELGGAFFEGGDSIEAAFEPVLKHAERHAWRIALGLGGVTFLNSRGISALLTLRTACERHGGCFVMYDLFEAAEHALVTLRLMPILKIASSREGAVGLCLEHGGSGDSPGAGASQTPGAAPTRPPRLAVMLSGAGRTLANLAERIDAGSLRAAVALVIASRPCRGAELADRRGFPVRILPGRIPRHDLDALLRQFDVDYVVLAGYLNHVEVPDAYRNRIINIHPALLPRHGGRGMYGHHVHESVLRSGDTESGCTVHLVDEHYDTGPVLLQRRCPVLPGDTPDSLASRVFELEKEAYPDALSALFDRAAGPRATKRAP